MAPPVTVGLVHTLQPHLDEPPVRSSYLTNDHDGACGDTSTTLSPASSELVVRIHPG